MAPKVNISLDRYGDRGWKIAVHTEGDEWDNGLPKLSLYRTDEQGRGLWKGVYNPEDRHEDGSPRITYEHYLDVDSFSLYPTERRAYDKIRYQISKGVIR